MRMPHENDPLSKVLLGTMTLAANVLAEPEVASLAAGLLQEREELKQQRLVIETCSEESTLILGSLRAAEWRTEWEYSTFVQRLMGELSTKWQWGDETSSFKYLFRKKAPSRIFPEARDKRPRFFDELATRVAIESRAVPGLKRLFEPLQQAIEKELELKKRWEKAEVEIKLQCVLEERKKKKLVAAVRAMVKAVQSHYADHPAWARRVLGHLSPSTLRHEEDVEELPSEEAMEGRSSSSTGS